MMGAGKSDQEAGRRDGAGDAPATWDEAKDSRGADWHPALEEVRLLSALEQNRRTLVRRVAVFSTIVLICGGLFWILVPNSCVDRIVTNDTAARQNLKALATAQEQYNKITDEFSTNGALLNSTGTLLAADFMNAFENWQENGDAVAPQPKAGYVFRMLQGNSASAPTDFRCDPNDPRAGMKTWGAIARAAVPGTTGERQYYIDESGTVWMHDEPARSDPRYSQFLLDATQTPAQLRALGWTVAK